MSDACISIVPKISNYPDRTKKAAEIVDWLISKGIIESSLSNCILGPGLGYAILEAAKTIVPRPEFLPLGERNLNANGLEIITRRKIFNSGGIDNLICPACKQNIAQENWDFDPWANDDSDNLICPKCNNTNAVHSYAIIPEWGFSDLGFTFWNWTTEFKEEFIMDFKQKLGCEIAIVYWHI